MHELPYNCFIKVHTNFARSLSLSLSLSPIQHARTDVQLFIRYTPTSLFCCLSLSLSSLPPPPLSVFLTSIQHVRTAVQLLYPGTDQSPSLSLSRSRSRSLSRSRSRSLSLFPFISRLNYRSLSYNIVSF